MGAVSLLLRTPTDRGLSDCFVGLAAAQGKRGLDVGDATYYNRAVGGMAWRYPHPFRGYQVE